MKAGRTAGGAAWCPMRAAEICFTRAFYSTRAGVEGDGLDLSLDCTENDCADMSSFCEFLASTKTVCPQNGLWGTVFPKTVPQDRFL
jgi:hypothetical protein